MLVLVQARVHGASRERVKVELFHPGTVGRALGPSNSSSLKVRFLPVSQYLLCLWVLECGVLTAWGREKLTESTVNTVHCVSILAQALPITDEWPSPDDDYMAEVERQQRRKDRKHGK